MKYVLLITLFLILIITSCFPMGEKPQTLNQTPIISHPFGGIKGGGSTISTLGKLLGQLSSPTALSISSSGIFIADAGNDRIQKLDFAGDYLMTFGQFGYGNGQFNQVSGVANDFDQWIYIVDQANNRIQKFDSKGQFVLTFGSYGSEAKDLNAPEKISVDQDGYVYVADAGNNRIVKYRNDGSVVKTLGSFGWGPGFFKSPVDIAIDKHNRIYVCDHGNNRIQVFDENFNYLFAFGQEGTTTGSFKDPRAIAINEDILYVCDTGNQRIQYFDLEGKSKGQYETGLDKPVDIAISRGKVYVLEQAKGQVIVMSDE